MAVRLARHARRQQRLARDRHRLLQPADPWLTPREQTPEETSCLARLVAHLTRRLTRFHAIYTPITFGCLFAFWLPSTVDSSFRRYLKSERSVNDHLLIPSNSTQTYSLESSILFFGFIDESSFQVLVRSSYAFVAVMSIPPHLLQKHLPIIETIDHHRFFFIFLRSIIPLTVASIASQLVSGFIDRPLDMLADFRVNSFLIVQIIGFLLCLFSSFIFGVVYASVQQSKPSLRSS